MIVDIIEAMRQGDFAAALAASRDTLAAEPDNAEAHHLLGVCLQQKGDLAGARNERQQLDCDEKLYRKVVKQAFQNRRKTLRNQRMAVVIQKQQKAGALVL